MGASNERTHVDDEAGAASLPEAFGAADFDGDRAGATNRKRSEDAARESGARYRALTQMSPSAILVACGGRCVFANDAAVRLLNAGSPRELVGQSPIALVAPEHQAQAQARFQKVLEQRTPDQRVRYRWRRCDGTEVDVDVAAGWVEWDGEDAVQIVAHDVTEEALVDEALRESRARLREELEDARRLQAVSTHLIQADDTGALHRELLQEAMQLMRADFGSVQEIDEENSELRLLAYHGFDPASAAYWSSVPHGTGASCGRAVATNGRVLVEDVDSCAFMQGTQDLVEFRRSGIRAMQSTPLVARDGTLVGMMSTHWRAPHVPAERELRLLDVLARQAADLLDGHRARARLSAAERRKSFLLRINDRLRQLADAGTIQFEAAAMLGEHLGATRVGYAEDRGDGATIAITRNYTAGAASLEGVYRYDDFGRALTEPLQAGRTVVRHDIVGDAASTPAEKRTYQALGIGAMVDVPLMRDGRLVGLLFVHIGVPRRWSEEEVALIEDVAARTWEAVERSRAEARLRESEERLGTVFEALPVGVGFLDSDGVMRLSNREMRRFLPTGVLPSRDAARHARWRAVYPDGRTLDRADFPGARALRGDVVVPGVEFMYTQDDGSELWTRVSAMPLRGSDGGIVGAVVVVTDIDGLKRSAEALRESEQRFRRLVESNAQAVWETDAAGVVVADSPSWRAYTGQTLDELRGYGWLDAVHPDDRAHAERAWREAVTAKRGLDTEFRVKHAPGAWRWTNVRATPLLADDGTVAKWVGMNLDIDARKAAETALRESEERFRTLIENVRDYAIFMLDADGRVIEWTDGAVRVKGYSGTEVMGRHLSLFFTQEDVERGEPQRELEEAERVGRAEREAWRVCNGGKRIWVNEIATEVRGADGVLRGFTMISRDLTDRRRAEQALADAARHKDEFLAMLSHELRNPLAPIRNSVYVLRHVAGDSEAGRHAQSVIERQTQHLARIVDDLLDVTRIARGKIELRNDRVELRELVRRAGEDFRAVFEDRGIGFRVQVPRPKAWCLGDATRINQAIGNMLTNAAKFTRAGDRVELVLTVEADEAQIRVSDTGIGIAPDLLPHLFDPFVQGDRTLARSEGGLGLGLALVKGIVELHGGRVRAASEGEDRGADFVMRLPLASGEPARAGAAPREAREGRALRVLVVDDNADAAESLAAVAELLGHEVEIAYDGPSAIARATAAPPDVVLCDIGLPRMSGYEVVRALRADAGFRGRLLAVSGYAQPDDVRKGVEAGFDGHLAKPFDPEQLARLLG